MLSANNQNETIKDKLSDYTSSQQQEALNGAPYGMEAEELADYISDCKKRFKKEATTEEVDEAFKYFKI
jgi:hypothetical protein